MLETQHLLYHSNKISFILWHLPWRLQSLIFHKTFHVVHDFFIYSFIFFILYNISCGLSFGSCKYLLVSHIQVLEFFLAKCKNLIFSSNIKVFFASLPASCCFHSLRIAMLSYVSFQNDVRIAFHFKAK